MKVREVMKSCCKQCERNKNCWFPCAAATAALNNGEELSRIEKAIDRFERAIFAR